MKAGIARREITPAPGTWLIGYGNRFIPNWGAKEPLSVTALTLQTDAQTVTLVSCDLLAVTDATRERVQSQVGHPVLLHCTHTHSGPVSHADERSPKAAKRYVAWLVNRIVDTINDSAEDLQSVTLQTGSGETGIAINRRQRNGDGSISVGFNPDGPVDRAVGVLQVVAEGGQPLATVVNTACHPTVLDPGNSVASPDWVGVMRAIVKRETGAPVLFLQGACGDLNPRLDHTPSNRWGIRFEIGEQAAGDVLDAMQSLTPMDDAPLDHSSTYINLPLEPYTGDEAPEYAYRVAMSAFANVPRWAVDPLIDRLFPWASIVRQTADGPVTLMRLDVVRVGELLLFGMGAEVFTEIGTAIKQSFGDSQVWVSGVTNGCITYLPTASEHALGGYEVDIAPYLFRLPGRLTPNADALVIDRVQRMAKVLAT